MSDRKDFKEQARKIIARRNLGGLANDTKWGEFFSEFKNARIALEFKFIDDERPVQCGVLWMPVPGYIEGNHMAPYPFIYIEWVRSHNVEPVVGAAKAAGLEVIVEDGTAVVYGYR
ncbi:DUF6678 family protein [Nevskia soli]|uniref:DUF6678 family protein n=1 Tax=Nevskia soli TaxID=418856 RepID=UPI0004A7611B|nr:DUF6678 family protein [Nevskia soli]